MRTASVCTGYAGLDMAVHEVLGGELAWVADIDPGASAILAHRFPSLPNLGDISAADWSAVESVDVLTAGFPCQDVSCAGGRAGLREGNRTGVWAHVARAIDELRPSLVVLENVRGLLTFGADSDLEPCPWCMGDSGDESVLRACGAVLADLADLGFDAEWALVSAAEVGAPHRRERIFILAWPAADAERDGHGRRAGSAGEADALRPGSRPAAEGCSAPAEDADRTTSDERRQSAPGQTAGGRSRADAGRSGGMRALADADIECLRSHGRAAHGHARINRPDNTESARGGGAVAAYAQHDGLAASQDTGTGESAQQRQRGSRRVAAEPAGDGGERAWGSYELAIRRWERVIDRPAPCPTEPGRTGERLSPRFVEWMMGLPEGWVTDIPGLSRNAQLKALGNGVVPQQAAMALRMLLERTGIAPLVAAEGAA